MTHRLSAAPFTAIAIAIAIATAAHAADPRPVEIRKPLDADAVVTVKNINGSVTVDGWDKKELEVTGTISGDVEEVAVSGSGSRMRVEVRFPENQRRTSGSAELRLRVPSGASVRVNVVNADITVAKLEGDVDLEAVNGDIGVTGKPGQVVAKTVNGDIRVQVASSRVEAETVGGRIQVEGVSGDVSGASVGGDIQVSGGRLERARLTTVSGSVEVDAEFSSGTNFQADSHSGDVTLHLPANVSAEFDINTFSGDIRNGFGPQPVRKSYGPGRDLSFTQGSGAARVSINTFSGDVDLMKK